jgi:hypothetical protein
MRSLRPQPSYLLSLLLGLQTCTTMSDLFVEMGVRISFFLGWPQTLILLIYASWLAGITGVSHCALGVVTLQNSLAAINSNGGCHI